MAVVVYVSIGNSDDKLTQLEWSRFYADVDEAARAFGHVHGAWASLASSRFQNAAWCVEMVNDELRVALRRVLRDLARTYKQDSIAWAVVPMTEFLPATREV